MLMAGAGSAMMERAPRTHSNAPFRKGEGSLQRSHRVACAIAVLLPMLPVLVAGCASNPQADELRTALQAAPVCCSRPSDFPFRPLAIAQRTELPIDTASPAFNFPQGKSFFGAFVLPASPRPAFATVASFPVLRKNALDEWGGSYFAPVFIFYDEHFMPSAPFEAPARFLFDGNGRRFSALRAPVSPEARYLVVLTDARRLNTTLPIPTEFNSVDTSAVACDTSGKAADPGTAALAAALCGLFAGLSIYTPAQSGTSYATIPHAAGGNLELWLSMPEPKQP